MAEVLASAATGLITSLLGKLANLLGDEYTLLHEVRADVEFLQGEPSGMDVLLVRLVDMEKRGHDTKKWRVKLRDLAYEVEDGIDSFTSRLGCAHDREGFLRGSMKQLNLMVRHQVAKQIQELRNQIEVESARQKRYNQLDGSSVNAVVADEIDSRVKALYVDPDHQLVGMDGPVANIVELLTLEEDESAKQLKIVSIYGPGGLGKTTLANQVHRKIKGEFDYAALVSVSQRPNLRDILGKIAPSVIQTDSSTLDTWQLLKNVKDFLQDKRYLIVFDDIWGTEIWNHLKSVLPRNNKKSRVITTTRIFNVARSCCSQSSDRIYKMESLNDADSKELFSKIIFDHKGKCPKALDEIANKILKKCGGIPLAIITIASLLAKKPKTMKEWKRVKSSIGNARELKGMRQTLSLSFYDLSYDLRNCFLSLSMFPEDYEIDRERLVLRWIAEGFISRNEQYELEQGDNYFNELVNRSLIQPVDIQYNGSARACRVHDLMLELIVSLSKEENFITTLNGPECLPMPSKIRWLSLHSSEHEVMQVVTNNRRHVRSVTFFPPVAQLPPFSEFHAMRVFDVKGCQFGKCRKMKNINSLIQLKYLNLSDTNVTELPEEIGQVHFLETLDVRNCPIQSLPASLCRLQKLVRLFVSLGIKLPDKIGKMQALEELSHVAILCNSLKFVEALGELTKLRVFRMDCRYLWLDGKKQAPRHANVSKYEDALLSSLRNLCRKNFESLQIDLTDDSSLVFSLMDSYCPLPQLEELVISNFISRVPGCMRSLKDIIHLEIKLDRMEEEDLHIIRDMSASLLFLRIHLGRTPEERLVIDAEGFECLKQFEFCCDGMGLKFVQGAMPDLEKLDLDIGVRTTTTKCGGFDFGIKNLEALKHVCVKLNCRYAESREIQAAEAAIRSGVVPRRIMPQIQRIGW